ncbi:hypothetical protein AMTRI_Chr02g219480 [Amborella trichopoda]
MKAAKPRVGEDVHHIPGTTINLVSVMQITAVGYFGVFGLDDVKVFEKLKIKGDPIMHGCQMDEHYILSAGTACVVDEYMDEAEEWQFSPMPSGDGTCTSKSISPLKTGIRETCDAANESQVGLT